MEVRLDVRERRSRSGKKRGEGGKAEGEEEEEQEEGRWAGRVEAWSGVGKVSREDRGRAASS